MKRGNGRTNLTLVTLATVALACGDVADPSQRVARGALTFDGLSIAQMSDVVVESGDVNHQPPYAAGVIHRDRLGGRSPH